MAAAPPLAGIDWPAAFRLIPSRYPPVDLFERIADPTEWEALAQLESLTNPRLREQLGEIAIVPPERRVSGPNASWVMAPFTHCSRARPSRFSDGAYGVYYAADGLGTAIREVAHHMGRFYAATGDPRHREDYRILKGAVAASLHDVRGGDWRAVMDPDDYGPSQALGRRLRAGGSDGVVYGSVRDSGGQCVGAFWPDVVGLPVQAGHLAFLWDGTAVSRYFDYRDEEWRDLA